MAWWWYGDKPLSHLSEAVMVCLLTHIWVTLHQWVKELIQNDTLHDIIDVDDFSSGGSRGGQIVKDLII